MRTATPRAFKFRVRVYGYFFEDVEIFADTPEDAESEAEQTEIEFDWDNWVKEETNVEDLNEM